MSKKQQQINGDINNHYSLKLEELEDIAEYMWAILCNVSGGKLSEQPKDWQEAFKKCRRSYFNYLKIPTKERER